MTPAKIEEFKAALQRGKVSDDKLSPDRVFLRGWNEGIEFAEKLTKILNEPEEKKNDA